MDSIVMWLEVYTIVCMLDRAGLSSSKEVNDLFRFSTTEQTWELFDATRVSGSPPSPRYGHFMVSVGSDLYVFGGRGDTRHCGGVCQIERLQDAPRAAEDSKCHVT
jgi:N-acetylneuraminic acid mutarotase